MKYILVATKNQKARDVISTCFKSEYQVEITATRESCFEMLQKKRHEYVFVDLEILRNSKEDNYKDLLQPFWKVYPTTEIVVLTKQEMISDAVKAVRAGASNYLTYPLNSDAVKHITADILASIQLHSELDYLRDKYWRSDSLSILRTNSTVMKDIFTKVHAVAQTDSTVLLTGVTFIID